MGVYTQSIQQLYVAYFNRPADSAGLAYWESVVAGQNGSTALVSAEFAKSAEYRAAYQGKSSAEVVNQVYLNLFGRAAEESGKAFWANALDKGVFTVDNVVTMVAHGAQSTDLEAYNAKVAAASAFTQLLPTDPNVVAYAGTSGIAAAKEFISSITSNASLALAIRNDNLLAALAAVKSASLPAVTVNLSSGVDSIGPGPSMPLTGDDIFNALSIGNTQTFNDGDSLNGGLGKNTLNLTSTNALPLALAQAVSIANIQIANISAQNTVSIDSRSWNGLRQINLTALGGDTVNATSSTAIKVSDQLGHGSVSINGGSDVTLNLSNALSDSKVTIGAQLAPTGAVVVNNGIHGAGNRIEITGGSSVSVSSALLPNDQGGSFGGSVIVNGKAQTASVSISNANPDSPVFGPGIAASATINDGNFGSNLAGSIHAVTLKTFQDAVINDTGLSSLTLNGGATVQINNAGLSSGASTTLALALERGRSGFTTLQLTDQGVYNDIKLNLTDSGSLAFTFLDLFTAGLHKLEVSGGARLFLNHVDTGTPALQTITVSGMAGVDADLRQSAVTVFDASGADNPFAQINNITLDPSKTSFTGGVASDIVTINSIMPGKAINGGEGVVDTLRLGADLAGSVTSGSSFTHLVSNFEALELLGGGSQTLDLSALGGISKVSTSGGDGQILNNFASRGALTLTGSGVSYTLNNALFAAGKFDVVGLTLQNTSINPVNFASKGLSVNQVEYVTIDTGGLSGTSGSALDVLTLNADSLQQLSIQGKQGLDLVLNAPALSNLVVANSGSGLFKLKTGPLTGAALIGGNSDGPNQIDISAGANFATVIGGNAADIIKVGAGNNTLFVKNGADQVIFTQANATLSDRNTIIDAHAGMSLTLPGNDQATFHGNKLVLAQDILLDYVNAAVKQAGNASSNGGISWFQYSGDTYILESHHDGSAANASFLGGSDFLVRLSGSIDLSHASLINGNTLVLA